MRLILGEGLWLSGFGAAIGIAASIVAARLMESVVVEAAAWDLRPLAATAVVVVAVWRGCRSRPRPPRQQRRSDTRAANPLVLPCVLGADAQPQ